MHNSMLKALRNPVQRSQSMFHPVFLKFTGPWKSLSASSTFEMLVWSHQIQISTVFLWSTACLFFHVSDFAADLIWRLSCPAGLAQGPRPHFPVPVPSLLLARYPCWSLTSHLKYHPWSSWPVKNEEIWGMTNTMTPICFCCHIVASGYLSRRQWWAYSACDVEGLVPHPPPTGHLGRQWRWAKDYNPER